MSLIQDFVDLVLKGQSPKTVVDRALDEGEEPQVKVQTLGNLIGGGSYFGACAKCRTQFMSTHDRVAVVNGTKYCMRCAHKLFPDAVKESMIENPQPKFKLGQKVRSKSSPSMTGEVSFVGSYDDYLGGYRYKVLEPSGRRNNWNEKDMVLVGAK